MKKLAILFLLTAVFVSFTFAQVSIKAEFNVDNVAKGNTVGEDKGQGSNYDRTIGVIGVANPVLKFVFDAGASKDLGPGSLSFSGTVGLAHSFKDTDYQIKSGVLGSGFGRGNEADYATDDLQVTVAYTLPIGPGKLGFSLANKYDPGAPTAYLTDGTKSVSWGQLGDATVYGGTSYQYLWTLEPGISYKDIGLGPVTLGAGLYYEYKYMGISTDNNKGRDKGAAFYRPYGDSMSKDLIIFKFFLDTQFGLALEYNFQYGWGKDATNQASFARVINASATAQQGLREIVKIAYLNVSYTIAQPVKVGLEVDDTGPGFRGAAVIYGGTGAIGPNKSYNTETSGFTLKPYAEFNLGDIGLGAYLQFKQVLATNVDAELIANPGVWVKYTL
jgi:hypothetical protein